MNDNNSSRNGNRSNKKSNKRNFILLVMFLTFSYIYLLNNNNSNNNSKLWTNINIQEEKFDNMFTIDVSGYVITGIASYYTYPFEGRLTASGDTFRTFEDYTVAHRTLPFGTELMIINPENNKAVMAKVNDRGPYITNRMIDVTYRIAEELEMVEEGLQLVNIIIVEDRNKINKVRRE